jgi:thymidylate synthase (FAD)
MRCENIVKLLEFAGSDLSHARAAWASTNQEITSDKLGRVPQLLKFLAENEHGTPFEHSMLSFHIQGDIASHIHCLKHRTGVSINTESARYKEMRDDLYYLPEDWPSDWEDQTIESMESLHSHYHALLVLMDDKGYTRGRAKEISRYLLPYAHQLRWVMTFNFRSFMHFQKLRNSEHAQKEIREIAQKMLDLAFGDGRFNHSLAAYGYEYTGSHSV